MNKKKNESKNNYPENFIEAILGELVPKITGAEGFRYYRQRELVTCG